MTAANSGRSTRASTPLRPCVHSRAYMFFAVPSSRRSVVAPFRRRAVSSSRQTYAPDTRAVIAQVPSSPFRRRAGHTRRTHAPDTLTGHTRWTHTPDTRPPVVASSRRSVVAQFRRRAVSRRSVVAPFRRRAVSSSRRTYAPDVRAGHTRCYSAGSVVAVPSSRRSVVVPDTRAGHTRRTHAPDTRAGHTRRTHAHPVAASSRRSVVAPFRCCAVPLSRRFVVAPDLRAGHTRCYSAGSVVAIPSSRRSVVAPFRRHAGST